MDNKKVVSVGHPIPSSDATYVTAYSAEDGTASKTTFQYVVPDEKGLITKHINILKILRQVQHMNTEQIHQEINEIKHQLAKQDVFAAERAKDIEYIKEAVQRIEKNVTETNLANDKVHEKINTKLEKHDRWIVRATAYFTAALFVSDLIADFLQEWIKNF